MEIAAASILPGNARGTLLITGQPISFWGCVDPATGRISDKRHDLYGESITGRILAFPFGKGSSTGSLMILELLRLDLGPAAIINIRTEPLLATGPVVGRYLYDNTFPIVTVSQQGFDGLETGRYAGVMSSPDRSWVRVQDPGEEDNHCEKKGTVR